MRATRTVRFLKLISGAWVLFLVVSACAFADDGMDAVLTNVNQLATVFSNPPDDFPLMMPLDTAPTNGFPQWWVLTADPFWRTDRGIPIWWTDFSVLPTNLTVVLGYQSTTNASGIQLWPLKLIRYEDTGAVSVQYPITGTELLSFSPPPDYQPDSLYETVLREWLILGVFSNWQPYDELVAQYPDLAPQRLILPLWIADINDMPACETTAGVSPNGMFMMSEEDDGGGDGGGGSSSSCNITNLTQPFFITSIGIDTNRYTTITWQSCQIFRYLIFSASSLSTNTQWTPQAYVWGQTNASTTSWTDMTTTNASVTQMFYRVQRLLGSPIAAGSDFSVVIRSDGTLWAWGDNGGELGDGLGGENQPVEPYLPYPGEVANVIPCAGQAITNAVAVAAGGDDYTVVVDANGAVWAFGESDGGQLGNGVSCYGCVTNSPAPVQVIGASNIVAVAAGFEHTLALCNAGTVTAWGNNSDTQDAEDEANLTGQLGIGYQLAPYITNVPVASQFPTGVMIVAIAAGSYHSVALDNAGNVWTFGENLNGQLGNGLDECITQLNVTAPMMLTTISNVIAIAAGLNHTIVLREDKTVWTWGDDSRGELGRTLGGSGCSYDDPLPGQVAASGLSNNVVAIAAGAYFSLAVTSNGQVYAWGDNQLGELGTDGPTEVYTQMLVAGISNVVWASAPRANDPYNNGGLHSLVMTLDQGTNHYWGWGDNTEGEIGNATTSGNETNYYYYEGSPPAPYVTTPTGPVQFCTRCQRTVQLGTSGSFTAECNGMLHLYFNTADHSPSSNGTNSYFATVVGLATNVAVSGLATNGVAVGGVTNGGVYFFSASGFCQRDISGDLADPNGQDPSTNQVDCSLMSLNITNAICPTAECFSLVGKIQ